MSRRAVWDEVTNRFAPDRLVDAAWRAARDQSPAKDILRGLTRPGKQLHVLVTGTVGTGKSTELLRMAEARRDRDVVVFLDLGRHFRDVVGDERALQNVSSWEVVFLAGLSVVRVVDDLLGLRMPLPLLDDLANAWKRLAQATEVKQPPQVDVGSLAKGMFVLGAGVAPALGITGVALAATTTGLAVLKEVAGAAKWNLPIGTKKKTVADQEEAPQSMLQAVNTIIGHVQTTTGARVVLVIDGLDRVLSFPRAASLFIESEIIGRLEGAVIATGPFALRSHPAAARIPRFDVQVLVNVPVVEKADPSKAGPGVEFFCEVFRKRTADLPGDLVPTSILETLAYYSGGRARDFVKLVNAIADEAWHADADQADQAMMSAVLDKARRLLETGLDKGHIAVLQAIADDPLRELPRDPTARELLEYGHLLPYPNESEWYFPHPLLTLHKVRLKEAGSSSSRGP
jgi:hypothetical protein